jgi:hypothetical protein
MAWMFDTACMRGAPLNRLLHKQHRTVSSYDRHTRSGFILEPEPVPLLDMWLPAAPAPATAAAAAPAPAAAATKEQTAPDAVVPEEQHIETPVEPPAGTAPSEPAAAAAAAAAAEAARARRAHTRCRRSRGPACAEALGRHRP